MIMITSPDFNPGETIPDRFTCGGQNVSPAFRWTGIPEGAKELMLICDDPDAPGGTFHHWVAYGIAPDRDFFHSGFGSGEAEGPGFHQAVNDFGTLGYGGPCPPKGDKPHAYHFKLFALDDTIEASEIATCAEVIERAKPHIIDQAEIVGYYGRDRG